MAFQGFAREERLSDNQIRIDISSVIENDLAEANRQTKYLGRNADLEGQWSNIYLNKLIKKHEVEKRNREENFTFFMKNREEIHKIVQYNNEVKYKDAGVNRHVKGLDSILGEGLLKLAVDVGSVAISKLAEDARADWDAKQADKKDSAKADATSVENQLTTPEKRKEMTRLTEMYVAGATQQVEDALNDPNNIFYGNNLITADAIGHYSKLNDIQKQRIQYSPENVAKSTLEWATKQEIDVNGRLISLATVGGMNPATQSEFFDKLSALHAKEFVPEDINAISRGVFSEQFQKLNHKWQHATLNKQIANAKLAEHTRIHRDAQIAYDEGGTDALYAYMVTGDAPGSPVRTQDRKQSIDLLFDMFESGALPASALREIGHKSFSPNSPESLYDQLDKKKGGTPSETALRFKKLLRAATVNEARDLQNKQAEAKLGVARMLEAVPNLSKKEARSLFYALQNKGGELYETVQGAGNKELTKLSQALSEQAGITPAPSVIDLGQKYANKLFNKPFRTGYLGSLVTNQDNKQVDLSASSGADIGKLKADLDYILEDWIGGQINRIGGNPEDPAVQTEIMRILNDPKDDELIKLKAKLQVQTIDPATNQIYPEGPQLINFNLRKMPIDGLKAYNKQIAKAIKEGRKVGLNEINFDGLLAWARGVSNAIGNDNIDQQNALSLQDPIVLRIMERNKGITAGRIYNAAVKYFNKKGMDFQTLPQSQYPTPEQVSQLNDQFGAHYSNASVPLQRVIERNHANGGHPPNTVTRGIIGKLEGNVPQNERYRSGDVGTPNAQGVWRNQFYADQAASIAAAYPNMTWTSTLRSDAHNRRVGGVANSKHKQGISFDVEGADAQKLKQDIDSGKVKGLDYYIGPGYTHVHFNILGTVSIGGNN